MESLRCPPLVSANWLKSEMMIKQDYKSNIRLLDATWDLPMFKRNFVQEHNDKRIPGAKYFSLDECRDKTSGLPNMLAKPEDFAKYVQDLAGIENDHHIVLYDNSERFGLFSAPRAWFVFKVMGHEKVSILDGGLPNWVKEGYETVSGEYKDEENYPPASTKYVPKYRPELVKEMAFMKANSQSASPVQVMDGRPNGRFRGIAPEPNPAIPSGHFANASNLPFFELFNMEKKVMKQPDEILEVFNSFKIDLDKDVISSCGSGIAASTLAFGAFFSKGKEVPLYDGSWTEWATKMPELIISEKES